MKITPIRLSWLLIGALIGSLFLAAACNPMTPVRRSLYAPRPTLPARIGDPLETGQLRVVGQLNSASLTSNRDEYDSLTISTPGTPGVLTPRLQIGGAAYLGLSEYIEIGGQANYSHMSWTRANTNGVLPFPEDDGQHLLMAGLGARINAPLSNGRFTLSLLMELNVASLPQAYFECIHSLCETGDRMSWSAEEGVVYYRVDRVQHERVFLPQGAIHFLVRATEELGVFALLGAQTAYRNNGFDLDADSLGDDSLDSYLISTIGLGLDLHIHPLVFTAAVFGPLHQDTRIRTGASLVLQAGLSF